MSESLPERHSPSNQGQASPDTPPLDASPIQQSQAPLADNTNNNAPPRNPPPDDDDDPDKMLGVEPPGLAPHQSQGSPRPSGNNGCLPSITPSMAELGRIPYMPTNRRKLPHRGGEKTKHPNQMVKMSTVTMTNKNRSQTSRVYYNNYVENKRPRKVVTWDEANNSRPPLRIDMEGPTSCSYTPRNKPLYETNAPAWSFGQRTFVERDGGARTSWEKTWFQNQHVWTQKADFFSDRRWPAPPSHPQKRTVGARLASLHAAPQHTFGYKREFSNMKKGVDTDPGPNEYNIDRADTIILASSPAYSHSVRRGGTAMWGSQERTPGPGTYRPEKTDIRIKRHQPAFTIRGTRRSQVHQLGPFAAF